MNANQQQLIVKMITIGFCKRVLLLFHAIVCLDSGHWPAVASLDSCEMTMIVTESVIYCKRDWRWMDRQEDV